MMCTVALLGPPIRSSVFEPRTPFELDERVSLCFSDDLRAAVPNVRRTQSLADAVKS